MDKLLAFMVEKGGWVAVLFFGVIAVQTWIVAAFWKRINQLQDSRIEDVKRTTDVLTSSSRTIEMMSQSMDKRTAATEALAEAQKALTAAIEKNSLAIGKFESKLYETDHRMDRVLYQAELERAEILRMFSRLDNRRRITEERPEINVELASEE